MYLNVNLAPPSTGTGPGNTPKTPEILDSLISLSQSSTYSRYQAQVNIGSGDLLSPSSTISSPCEEASPSHFGSHSASQMSPSSTDPGGGGSYILSRVSGIFRGCPAGFMAGTPSPPVPELSSPISTVENTKSALIKEGLKFQIKSKLKAAGKANLSLLTDSIQIKEENSDSSEDEERRLRRRERNKIAATKCRNKKKEKTITLMTESESVEDQNIRLKSEIERLTSEKNKLEKLLEDPCHIASCRKGTTGTAPLVIITSPDRTEVLSSPLSNVNRSIASSSGASIHQIVSDQSATECGSSYCTVSCGSSYEANTPSSSYLNLSPCSVPNVSPNPCNLSHVSPNPCSLSSLSPNPHTALQQHSPMLTSLSTVETSTATLTEIMPSIKVPSTSCMPHLTLSDPSLTTSYQQDAPTYSPVKECQQTRPHNHQHQPYDTINTRHSTPNHFQQRQVSPYSGSQYSSISDQSSSAVGTITDYLSVSNMEKSYYGYESSAALLLAPENLPADRNQSKTCNSNIGKIRTASTSCSSVRYSPYDLSNRNTPSVSHISDVSPVQNLHTDANNSNTFLLNQFNNSDVTQNNQFFSSCTYGNI